jgi:beta subunit of N-acylethanolamine-hydrolyzing acid amidase
MAPVTRSQTDGEPPLYTIDLSLPPRARYRQICQDYSHGLQALTALYEEVLEFTPYPRVLKYLAEHLLRRVRSSEETEEIRGIAELTAVPVHLVVAYNTFLDLFSGCVSGGVQVSSDDGGRKGMLHFRGLDWDMEPLRRLIIRVEYVRDGQVVARYGTSSVPISFH